MFKHLILWHQWGKHRYIRSCNQHLVMNIQEIHTVVRLSGKCLTFYTCRLYSATMGRRKYTPSFWHEYCNLLFCFWVLFALSQKMHCGKRILKFDPVSG